MRLVYLPIPKEGRLEFISSSYHPVGVSDYVVYSSFLEEIFPKLEIFGFCFEST